MKVLSTLVGIFILIILSLTLIKIFWYEPFQIPSSSMKPTLLPGDTIWVNKLTSVDSLKPGDIIVFYQDYKNAKVPYIKRIIGVAGDEIKTQDDMVFRNGKPLQRTSVKTLRRDPQNKCYVKLVHDPKERLKYKLPPLSFSRSYKKQNYFIEEISNAKAYWVGYYKKMTSEPEQSWVVPKDSFFVMGDNRSRSLDSRFRGYVKKEDIIGKATSVFFSLTKKNYSCGQQSLAAFDLYLRRYRAGLKL